MASRSLGCAGVLPFAFGRVVFRARESWDDLAVFVADGVPAAVVEVEVGVDDDVDVFRSDAGSSEICEELGGLAVELDHAIGELVAHAGFDQYVFLSGADEQRVKAGLDVIPFVGDDFTRPHDFGNDAEKGAAVKRVGAVGEDAEFEVAESQAGHEVSLPRKRRCRG